MAGLVRQAGLASSGCVLQNTVLLPPHPHPTHQLAPGAHLTEKGDMAAGHPRQGSPQGGSQDQDSPSMEPEQEEVVAEVDIAINNVVCSFSVGCHLNLKQIALNASNVEFRRESGMVSMKLRNPYTTASIWSSGKITCTGAQSEETSKIAARKYARMLQTLGFRARFKNFKIVNVLGTCTMPFAIKLVPFSQTNKPIAQYEPELHPGVTYKIKDIKATLKIFSTGSITVTAPSVSAVQQSIEMIYPLVVEHRKERTCPEDMPRAQHANMMRKARAARMFPQQDFLPEEEEVDDVHGVRQVPYIEDNSDSDQSWG